MKPTAQRPHQIPTVGHTEAMRLTAAENARLLAQLRGLTDQQWMAPTDCTGWRCSLSMSLITIGSPPSTAARHGP